MKKAVFLACIAFVSCQNQNATGTLSSKDSISADTVVSPGEMADKNLADEQPDSALIIQSYLVNNASVKKDFLFISETCGIFVPIDTVQIEHMIKEYGEDDFYTIADDNAFYEYQAAEFLKKMDVKSIYPKIRYLKFKVNGDTVCLNTKSRFNTQGITILYKTNTLPKLYSSIEIEQEYNSYFK